MGAIGVPEREKSWPRALAVERMRLRAVGLFAVLIAGRPRNEFVFQVGLLVFDERGDSRAQFTGFVFLSVGQIVLFERIHLEVEHLLISCSCVENGLERVVHHAELEPISVCNHVDTPRMIWAEDAAPLPCFWDGRSEHLGKRGIDVHVTNGFGLPLTGVESWRPENHGDSEVFVKECATMAHGGVRRSKRFAMVACDDDEGVSVEILFA